MPIPARSRLLFLPRGCPLGIYAGLALLSKGCPPGRGRLHTCYSPVRRSPARRASSPSAAPRLACVKPAASVHPEPGSNSPLFICFFFFQFVCPLRSLGLVKVSFLFRIDVSFSLLSCLFPLASAAFRARPFSEESGAPGGSIHLWHLCHCPIASQGPLGAKRDCKITTF